MRMKNKQEHITLFGLVPVVDRPLPKVARLNMSTSVEKLS